MRLLLLAFFAILLYIGCDKNHHDPALGLVDLNIILTNSPANVVRGQDIISNVKCSGSDLCYNFAKFEIRETAARTFEIKAKATYPKGGAFCPQAIYYKDTTLRIRANSDGNYILKFYNNNLLFKADTVRVN